MQSQLKNLENVVKKVNSKFKTGEIKMGVEFTEVQKIPFKSLRLNYMTYGGIPCGRLVEFFGAEGGGKTTTALDLIAEAQKLFPDKVVMVCDVEGTFDPIWAVKMGVDIENLYIYRADSQSAEVIFQTLLEVMDSGSLSLVLLDSIGAMVSELENEKEIKDRTYGGISQSLTRFSKQAIPICARNNCTLIGINQMRDDMQSQFGGTTTTGGKAWRHNCTTRLSFRKGNYVDINGTKLSRACENPAGNIVDVNLIKSKVCPPDRKVGFYTLNYMNGIDYVSDAVDVAIKEGIVKQAGAWFTLLELDGTPITLDGEELKFQGKSSLVNYLKEDEVIYEELAERITQKIC